MISVAKVPMLMIVKPSSVKSDTICEIPLDWKVADAITSATVLTWATVNWEITNVKEYA